MEEAEEQCGLSRAGRGQNAGAERNWREVRAGSDQAEACEPVKGVWASFSVQQEAVGGF